MNPACRQAGLMDILKGRKIKLSIRGRFSNLTYSKNLTLRLIKLKANPHYA
jgi:hypothetical protein